MKYYYSISEASKLTAVKPYVLRYWEQEFKGLCPKKTKGGRRVYTQKEIDLIILIKKLLYEEHYTIEGAKKKLNSIPHINLCAGPNSKFRNGILKEIEEGLKELLNILEGK